MLDADQAVPLSNSTCDVTSPLPGISIPDGFRMAPLMGRPVYKIANETTKTFQEGMNDFTFYDAIMKEPVPIIVTIHTKRDSSDVSVARMVCLTPNVVMKGSRVPEGLKSPNDESQEAKPGEEANNSTTGGGNDSKNGNSTKENAASQFGTSGLCACIAFLWTLLLL